MQGEPRGLKKGAFPPVYPDRHLEGICKEVREGGKPGVQKKQY